MDDQPIGVNAATGCLAVFASAMLTGLLLFLNGGVVLATLNALSSGGFAILRDERVTQFLVLIGPVVMVVIQWIMIDYVRTRLLRSRQASAQ